MCQKKNYRARPHPESGSWIPQAPGLSYKIYRTFIVFLPAAAVID
jgi:hypothetical protein